MDKKPVWFIIGDKLIWPLVGMGLKSIHKQAYPSPDLGVIPYLALCHHAGCLQASMYANEKGKHSTAVCLIRQSVESLTVVEIGLQDSDWSSPILESWKSGKKTQGQLRQALERNIWPKYGKGLWDENWSEFYGNLARAVQPYSHYTPELQGWQYMVADYDGGSKFTAVIGLETYDAVQATRVTLLHILLTWMLGRILLVYGKNKDVIGEKGKIERLGDALSESKLLEPKHDWGTQLAPHLLLKPGHVWMDE